MNAGQPLDATALAAYQAIWEEGFEDLPYDVLEFAFRRTLKEYKFWPVKVADVRERVDRTRETAVLAAADREWQNLLDYIQKWVSPDIVIKRHRPGYPRKVCDCPSPPKLSERVDRAARAAGGLNYLQNCSREDLQWAKKRFMESYLAWDTLEQDQFLLPDGEIKNLLAEFSQAKALPAPQYCFEDLHKRGVDYRDRTKLLTAYQEAEREAPEWESREQYAAIVGELEEYRKRFETALARRTARHMLSGLKFARCTDCPRVFAVLLESSRRQCLICEARRRKGESQKRWHRYKGEHAA